MVACVHVFAAVKDWPMIAKDLGIGVNHSLDNLPIDSSRTLVGYDGDVVVVQEAPWHRHLEVVGPQSDRTAVLSDVGPTGTDERHGRCRVLTGHTYDAHNARHRVCARLWSAVAMDLLVPISVE